MTREVLSSCVTLPVWRDIRLLNRLGGEEREGGGVREGARKRQVAKNKEERERECGGGLQTKPISTWGVCSQKCLSPGGRGKGEEA